MAPPAERADEVEKTDSGGMRRVVEAGSVACLVNRGRASIVLGSAGGGMSSVVEDGLRLPGHRARTRWRFVRLKRFMRREEG